MIILPSTYLPSVEYFAYLAQGEECVIDIGEHYIKRSLRNRTRIMTAAGVMELSVNIQNANRPQMPMREVKIDYSKRWQHQHHIAILSAYKSAPFYEHYAPYLEPILCTKYERLVDLNWALTESLIKLIGLTPRLTISQEYVEEREGDIDLRPKKRLLTLSQEPYIQVFYDRLPFEDNLSVLDLLLCEGTNSLSHLMASRI